MKVSRIVLVVIALLSLGSVARADENEDQAKALFADGNKLLGKQDYEGALAKYREAYARFPNAVILLNMGTALSKLGRYSEAIDTYRAYLASEGASEAKKALVKVEIDSLDSLLGGLQILVSEPGAKIKVDGKLVGEQAREIELRLDPGRHTVTATKPGFKPWQGSAHVDRGETHAVTIKLIAERATEIDDTEVDTETPALGGGEGEGEGDGEGDAGDVAGVVVTHVHKGRLGALVRADIQGNEFGKGGVVTVGLTYGIAEIFDVTLAGILGNTMGVYAGGTVYVTKGSFRPFVLVGLPIYFAEEATMVGIHGAAGIQYDLAQRAGLFLSLGLEFFPGAPEGYTSAVFVPSLGLQVRL